MSVALETTVHVWIEPQPPSVSLLFFKMFSLNRDTAEPAEVGLGDEKETNTFLLKFLEISNSN